MVSSDQFLRVYEDKIYIWNEDEIPHCWKKDGEMTLQQGMIIYQTARQNVDRIWGAERSGEGRKTAGLTDTIIEIL
ncbi:MAG: hypothetical protein HFG50_01910 [Lachnospiraceae bacterium]|nr:hypothetical protein [Lachnospiraceae bacterium]